MGNHYTNRCLVTYKDFFKKIVLHDKVLHSVANKLKSRNQNKPSNAIRFTMIDSAIPSEIKNRDTLIMHIDLGKEKEKNVRLSNNKPLEL